MGMMGRKPNGMSESEYREYVKRQGQETLPEIERFLPDGPPVLTEEEKVAMRPQREWDDKEGR